MDLKKDTTKTWHLADHATVHETFKLQLDDVSFFCPLLYSMLRFALPNFDAADIFHEHPRFSSTTTGACGP